MDCRQCQNLVDAYIQNTIDPEAYDAFINHVYSCEECMDELKISYSLLTALDQLDKGLELSGDYDSEIENRISGYIIRKKKRKTFRIVSYTLLLILSVCIGFLYSFFFIKDDNITYKEEDSISGFVFSVNGIPEKIDPVKQEIKRLNDDAVDYIHKLKKEDDE